MLGSVTIARLLDHPEALPTLARWYRGEWPAWYGVGGPGDAEHDLRSSCHDGSLPLGIVAFRDRALCGAAVLKARSIPSHDHLAPWAAGGYVVPELRGLGIGAELLRGLQAEAAALGYRHLYCGTATAGTLLKRAGWRRIDTVALDGKQVAIYRKELDRQAGLCAGEPVLG